MLLIWSSYQLTSKQWIITQQCTARVDLFLKYSSFLEEILICSVYMLRISEWYKK